MCITPSYIWDTRVSPAIKIPKSCGKCWRCRSNRVNDFVGRCLAEADTSDWTLTQTLTYAPRLDGAENEIHPQHFQNYVRALRKRGHKIRYLVAGERGELRGRVHFHCILFGKGKRPTGYDNKNRTGKHCEIPNKKNHWMDEWEHGHVFSDWDMDEKAIRYVCKYLLNPGKKTCWFSMSKKPPLGHQWFEKKAARVVDLQVYPSGFNYLPPGGHANRPYLMSGATRREYLRAIVKGNNLLPKTRLLSLDPNRERFSEWVNKALDQLERWEVLKRSDEIPETLELVAEMAHELKNKERDDMRARERRRKKTFDRFVSACQWWDEHKGEYDEERQQEIDRLLSCATSEAGQRTFYEKCPSPRYIPATLNNFSKESNQ